MAFIARLLRLFGMVTWIGGLIFFAFVEAPTAFHVMGTTRQFAELIGGSIDAINHLGLLSGLVFIGASLLLWRVSGSRERKLLVTETLLVALMLVATAYVQLHIVPAMERDRESVGGDINSVPADNPARADFDRLHRASETIEGSALFLGLGVILLMAVEDSRRDLPAAVTR